MRVCACRTCSPPSSCPPSSPSPPAPPEAPRARAARAGGTGGVAPVETCRASFHWLQKDAYKDTAGRTSNLWPPHTTTLLDVYCQLDDGDEELLTTTFQANHGTEPGAVDANGDVILVEVRADDIGGTRAQLLELVEAYKTCSCEAATKFLTLESLEDEAVQALVLNAISYLQAHLTCAVPGGTDAVTTALQNGDIAQVLANLPSCTWSTGSDLEQAGRGLRRLPRHVAGGPGRISCLQQRRGAAGGARRRLSSPTRRSPPATRTWTRARGRSGSTSRRQSRLGGLGPPCPKELVVPRIQCW